MDHLDDFSERATERDRERATAKGSMNTERPRKTCCVSEMRMRLGCLVYQSVLLGCAAYVNRDKSSIPTVNHSLDHPLDHLPSNKSHNCYPYNFLWSKIAKIK